MGRRHVVGHHLAVRQLGAAQRRGVERRSLAAVASGGKSVGLANESVGVIERQQRGRHDAARGGEQDSDAAQREPR
eukprot:6423372-Prymnesium_polylepis.1